MLDTTIGSLVNSYVLYICVENYFLLILKVINNLIALGQLNNIILVISYNKTLSSYHIYGVILIAN